MNSSLYSQTQKTNVAMVLIRPRLQDLEKRTWLWRKTVARQALRSVAFAHAETPEVAANLRALGLPFDRIEMLGPLVGAVVPLGFNEAERDELGGPLTSRPVWLAVNVPGDEVAMLAKAFIQAQRSAHRMLLILQTNDPIAANAHLIEQGLIVHHRDVEGEPDTLTQVFITDGNTEMGLWYRLASMAYMGGSFSDNPVASPLQAAALGSAILHGPLVSDHRDEYDRLAHGGASMGIEAEHQLADAIVTLLAPDQSATLANAAWQVVSDGAEVTDRLVDVILALIDQ